jgi:hypothetical protein
LIINGQSTNTSIIITVSTFSSAKAGYGARVPLKGTDILPPLDTIKESLPLLLDSVIGTLL